MNKYKLISFYRWIAVLPVAILSMLIIEYSRAKYYDNLAFSNLEDFIISIVSVITFVYIGAKMAPNRQILTSYVLFYLLVTVRICVIIYFGIDAYSSYEIISLVFSALCGIIPIRILISENKRILKKLAEIKNDNNQIKLNHYKTHWIIFSILAISTTFYKEYHLIPLINLFLWIFTGILFSKAYNRSNLWAISCLFGAFGLILNAVIFYIISKRNNKSSITKTLTD